MSKPKAYQNRPHPFHELGESADRKFEKLICTLYTSQIANGKISTFDKAAEMSGGHEKGRDVSLFKDQELVGSIQCKLYDAKPLTVKQVLEEIVKFSLYYLNDEKKGNLIRSSNYQHILIAAAGYNNDATLLLGSFRTRIKQPNIDLNNAIAKVKTDYKTLANAGTEQDLQNFFDWIEIKFEPLTTIESWLKQNPDIEKQFFDVRTVVLSPEKILKALGEMVDIIRDVRQKIEWLVYQEQKSTKPIDSDLALLNLFSAAFHRRAFQIPYLDSREKPIELEDALRYTLIVIATGTLRDPSGKNIREPIDPPMFTRHPNWNVKMQTVYTLLQDCITKSQEYRSAPDDALAADIDVNRVLAIQIFLEICQDAQKDYPDFIVPVYPTLDTQ